MGVVQDKLGVMIGIDECAASARISRYETGTHQPSWLIVEKLAQVLQVPVAYLFAEDDQMAELIRIFERLPAAHRCQLIDHAMRLAESS